MTTLAAANDLFLVFGPRGPSRSSNRNSTACVLRSRVRIPSTTQGLMP
jgi:hypothetical protein